MKLSIHSPRARLLVILAGMAVALGSLAALPGTATATKGSGTAKTYVVLYQPGASTSGAAKSVSANGGSLVANYRAIGVGIARSSKSGFATAMAKTSGVDGVAGTAAFATKVRDTQADSATEDVTTEATWGDALSSLQWDMRQINVPQAHEVTTGDSSVLVGDLDTGLDFTHPDLAPVFDAANSTDCSSGTPAPLLPVNDVNGHGTHTAGTIAAAANGTGIVGVAPGVRIAAVKSSNDDGFFFPEMVICAYMWVAEHGIDITNNSYFADPWLFNCKNDPVQRAIWNAERRAIGYAQSRGTTVIASEGNESTDLSHPTTDVISPDFPPGSEVERNITNACAVVPVEVPGVVGVTATGDLQLKSFYSSYGISTADVAAPGGDSLLQVTAEAPNGRVLSTYPSTTPCARSVTDPTTGAKYCYLQGTSMAGPHAVGVAALLASASGLSGASLASALQNATNPLGCPDEATLLMYEPFPQNSGAPQTCEGGLEHNSWYGTGEVDALKAVS